MFEPDFTRRDGQRREVEGFAEEPAAVEVDPAVHVPGETVHLPAGELRTDELRCRVELDVAERRAVGGEARAVAAEAAAEARAVERGQLSGELGAVEDHPAVKPQPGEVGVFEGDPGEVEVDRVPPPQEPGEGEPIADHAQNRLAHLGLARSHDGRLQPQVTTQHVDAHLALVVPVVGETGEGVDAGQPHGRAVVGQLLGGGPEAFVEALNGLTLSLLDREGVVVLSDPLLAVADGEQHHTTEPGDH